VHFLGRTITMDVIGERPFGNVAITDRSATGFRQSITVEIRPDLHQLQSTDYVQTADIVTVEIQPAVLPAVICPRKPMTML